MSEESKLLFANEAFYAAFAAKDLTAMQEAWSAAEPLFCLHPTWVLLVGRDAIMESWVNIFAAEGPTIRPVAAQAWIQGDVGMVVCQERYRRGILAATNLFRQEAGLWRLFHHHAGPSRDIPEAASAQPVH